MLTQNDYIEKKNRTDQTINKDQGKVIKRINLTHIYGKT